ncbi:hypothetical protein [Flavobacterium humi]|uniref:hypothetical protein n=1 Tax=Flavobacterium humi TaxID=2562683 RepID=UPI00146B8EEA|nr:hypothetical protein [Flavobacterium humi]
MINQLSKLSGASELSKEEQKAIIGAVIRRCCEYDYETNRCTLWVSGNQQCP